MSEYGVRRAFICVGLHMRKGWLGRHDSGMSKYGLQRAFVSVGLQMRKGRLGRYIRGACIRNKAGMHHCTRAHPRRRKRGPTQRAARRGRIQACVCTHPWHSMHREAHSGRARGPAWGSGLRGACVCVHVAVRRCVCAVVCTCVHDIVRVQHLFHWGV